MFRLSGSAMVNSRARHLTGTARTFNLSTDVRYFNDSGLGQRGTTEMRNHGTHGE